MRYPLTLNSFLWGAFRRYLLVNIILTIAFLGWTLDNVAWPYVFKLLIDGITHFQGDKKDLFIALEKPMWIVFLLWLYIETSYRIGGMLMAHFHPKLDADIHRDLFEYVQKHSHRFFSDRLVGSVADKIGGQMAGSAINIIQLIITAFIPALVAVIIVVVMITLLNPFFGVVLGVWCVVHMTIGIIGGRGISARIAEEAEARSQMHGAVIDSFGGYTTVNIFARRIYEAKYVDALRGQWVEKHRVALWYQEKVRFYMGLFGGAAYLGLLYLALYSWQQNEISTGDVVYVFTATSGIMMMVWAIASQHIPQLFKQLGICQQALNTVILPHDIVDAPNSKELVIKTGRIEFDKVNFHYVPQYNIFSDKSLSIDGGQKVGLVGFSGSGKSTFVNLILRFYDVESGRILIDGHNIAEVTQDSLRSQIAMIPQDTTLFHRSLMDNIRYGKLDASDDEVIAASKKAHCHEFIEKLPEGYQALVGERGVKLSGGQRQRIAIARAILKNAPILLLDEATSALDSNTEELIKESLVELMKGRTTIVIAHRLSTLLGLDRILVFDEGHIVEDGSHSELLSANGHYAKLWNMQAGGFLPEL